MLHSLFRAGLAMGLFGLLLVPGTARAQDRRVRHVQDDAHIFSKEAVSDADALIAKIHDKHRKDLFIETVKEGPEKADKAEESRWARDRFNDYKIDGVYVVLCKKPHFYRIEVGNKTREDGYFGTENIKELEKIIESKQAPDEMLRRIANYTFDTMNKHVPAQKQKQRPAPGVVPAQVQHHGGDGQPGTNWLAAILPWVCIIVGGLVVVWVIFAIIRAVTGMGGGGYGYGGGGYGGGMMGGGGGGFFTGMLGGLFGSMAGMWIYNNMFGGHASYGANGAVDWGGGGQDAAPYEGDTDTGASGGGDKWGGGDDDAGGAKGGDEGAGGGGDWGGGGDAGGGDAGGGDWGGGGDAGGGDVGGGDWGGGGGGDFGGGGGDFGGGGGGGDW